ncbi:MAG: VOC family protein [Caldilineaceae bacterium]|nr:VOC family protein [Caldilineaceae bacterium]
MTTIHPATQIGAVALTVADLGRSVTFYQKNIGLTVQSQSATAAVLGAGERTLLHLHALPGARYAPRTTGLYHFALRVPSRLELARTIENLASTRTTIDGASDHTVSEALYLHDPDRHGIEIYRDRPRADWYDRAGNFLMDTHRLDFEGIMGELAGDSQAWQGLHPDTDMGHIHLRVAEIKQTGDFYQKILGFGVMATMDSALFVSAGGYHHHIGMNVWAGVGVPAPACDAARLLSYEILLPDAAALTAVLQRATAAGVEAVQQETGWLVRDPSSNPILLRSLP